MKYGLFLFGPKFREYGADIAEDLILKGEIDSIYGICTGGRETVDVVRARLKDKVVELYDIEFLEHKWISDDLSLKKLKELEDEVGKDIVGRTIVSDRRIGAGFVFGGIPRPNWLKSVAKYDPVFTPVNYVAGLYCFLNDILKEIQPRFVFLYAVAGAPAFLLSQLCIAREILVLRPTSTRVSSLTVIDQDPLGKLECISNTFDEMRDSSDACLANKEWATKYLEEFRAAPAIPEYEIFNAKAREKNNLLSLLFKSSKRIVKKILSKGLSAFNDERVQRDWHKVRLAWKKLSYNRKLFNTSAPEDFRWVYFPLHVDPEASTMVLSPWHTNQLSIIESLAKALPSDSILIVKEHLPMLGCRPTGFYERISKIPRVILISPYQNGLWWVSNSDLTAVITGTAAWEAILLKKPAIVIGDSPFLKIEEGVLHEPHIDNLSASLMLAMNIEPASDEVLIRYLCAIKKESFEWPSSIIWGDYLSHSIDEKENAVLNFSENIVKRLRY